MNFMKMYMCLRAYVSIDPQDCPACVRHTSQSDTQIIIYLLIILLYRIRIIEYYITYIINYNSITIL